MMFNGLFHDKTNKKILSHNNLDHFLLEQLGVNNRVINQEIYAAMSSILGLYEWSFEKIMVEKTTVAI